MDYKPLEHSQADYNTENSGAAHSLDQENTFQPLSQFAISDGSLFSQENNDPLDRNFSTAHIQQQPTQVDMYSDHSWVWGNKDYLYRSHH